MGAESVHRSGFGINGSAFGSLKAWKPLLPGMIHLLWGSRGHGRDPLFRDRQAPPTQLSCPSQEVFWFLRFRPSRSV